MYLYFGMFLSVSAYLFGMCLKKKLKYAVFNPILIAVILVILVLLATGVSYEEYQAGASYLSYFLTPATVCLAIPLYKQLALLKKYPATVFLGIFAGVLGSLSSIFVLSFLFRLDHVTYVSLLPKSITTAIGMGVSEELGGVATLTVIVIIITGVLGNITAEAWLRFIKVREPIAKGLAIGTASHAIGTAKALELGEVEGAMSSLAIAVSGLITVAAAPIAARLL